MTASAISVEIHQHEAVDNTHNTPITKKEPFEIIFTMRNDIWMDNGLETFHSVLNDFQNSNFQTAIENNSLIIRIVEFKKFKEDLGNAVKHRRDNNLIIIDSDKKTGERKEIKKDYILIQEGAKIQGKVAFKENIYNNATTDSIINELFSLISEKNENRTCAVCGQQFSKQFKKLQQGSYPFVTKIKSLSGVRSYKDGTYLSLNEYFDDFCPACYLLGIIEWLDDGIIFRTIPGTKSTLFLPQLSTLEGLIAFKNSYRPLLTKNNRYRNIRVDIKSQDTENPPGTFSTLLCFYEKFFSWIDTKDVIGRSWAIIDIPFGAVKNLKFELVDLKESILDVIKRLSTNENNPVRIYSEIISDIFFFYDNPKGAPVDWDHTNSIREQLCKSLLKDDFHSFAKQLLPKKGGHVGYSTDVRNNLDDLIILWRFEKMGIPKESLDTIKSVGNIVARASKKNQSLFYKLDKARTVDDFWSVLREVSRKLISFEEKDRQMIKPSALDGIIQLVKGHENNWKEIRDLLIVYSAMYYSIGSRKEGDKNE